MAVDREKKHKGGRRSRSEEERRRHMFKNKVCGLAVLAAGLGTLTAGGLPVQAEYSKAYKKHFDAIDLPDGPLTLDHTYFCLNDDNDGHDCFTIVGFGVSSSKSGGSKISGTYHDKDRHQRCLARARASNSVLTVCGAMSQLYGINGVCHQHTNRGQLSMHGDFIDPDEILGGWASFLAYGAYGLNLAPCVVESEAACAFTW
jgi:hypothetical protein